MSTLKVNTIQNTSGGSSSTAEKIFNGRARVWCHYRQRNSVAIVNSFNVSSVTDVGTGHYRVNFSESFTYPVGVTSSSYDTNVSDGSYSDLTNCYVTSTTMESYTVNENRGQHDCDYNYSVVFCDEN